MFMVLCLNGVGIGGQAIEMSEDLVEDAVRWMKKGWLPSIPQDMTQFVPFQDIVWERVEAKKIH